MFKKTNLLVILVSVALICWTTGNRPTAKVKAQQDHSHEGHDHSSVSRKPTSTSPKRDPNRLWCGGHGVYEDECYICHPELKGASEKKPDMDDDHDQSGHEGHEHGSGGGADHLWCNEHNLAERECGICQPQLAVGLIPGQSMKVRLASMASAQKAGIRSVSPRLADTAASVKVYCEVSYNQNRLARITSLASGVIHRVHTDVGEVVSEGVLLVEVASAEVAAAKRDLLSAIVTERVKRQAFEREKELYAKEISAARHFQEAEGDYQMAQLATSNARQRLINYGFTSEEVTDIEKNETSSSIVHVHAPFDGTLVERQAVMGEAVEPGTPLFTLADLSTMWLKLSIPESKLASIKLGLPIEATFVSLPGVVATGKLRWINTAVSEPSRMVEARAEVSNADGRLRSNLFGEARITLSTEKQALTVPSQAVQRFENKPFVFVKVEEDLYELRRVEIGLTQHDRVQVVRGLKLQESVVVTGGFTMFSEFLKSRMGAGCVHD